jgi:periplasmic protein TonB
MSTQTAERRPLGALGRMGVVAAMHVGLLYLIANSLGIVPSIMENKTEATIIDERTPDEVIPDPEPYTPPRQDTLVLPEQPPDLVYESEEVITAPPAEVVRPPEHTGSAVVQPVIVGPGLDSRYPLSQPPYPPFDVRNGNTGTAEIEVYVMPNGRVGNARIVKSTGFASLDQSALDEAKRRWRLAPATRDGVPFAEWHRLKVTFKLNQQR